MGYVLFFSRIESITLFTCIYYSGHYGHTVYNFDDCNFCYFCGRYNALTCHCSCTPAGVALVLRSLPALVHNDSRSRLHIRIHCYNPGRTICKHRRKCSSLKLTFRQLWFLFCFFSWHSCLIFTMIKTNPDIE